MKQNDSDSLVMPTGRRHCTEYWSSENSVGYLHLNEKTLEARGSICHEPVAFSSSQGMNCLHLFIVTPSVSISPSSNKIPLPHTPDGRSVATLSTLAVNPPLLLLKSIMLSSFWASWFLSPHGLPKQAHHLASSQVGHQGMAKAIQCHLGQIRQVRHRDQSWTQTLKCTSKTFSRS